MMAILNLIDAIFWLSGQPCVISYRFQWLVFKDQETRGEGRIEFLGQTRELNESKQIELDSLEPLTLLKRLHNVNKIIQYIWICLLAWPQWWSFDSQLSLTPKNPTTEDTLIYCTHSEVFNKRAGRLCSVFSLKKVLVYLGLQNTGSSRLMRISLLRFFKTITKIWLMRFYGLFILLLRT